MDLNSSFIACSVKMDLCGLNLFPLPTSQMLNFVGRGRWRDIARGRVSLPGSGVLSLFPCKVQGTIPQHGFPLSSVSWHLPMGGSWHSKRWLLSEFCPLEHNTLPWPMNGCPQTPKSSFPASLPASTSGNISAGHSCALFNKVWTSALPGEGEDVAPSCRLVPFWGDPPQSRRLPTCVISVYLMGILKTS